MKRLLRVALLVFPLFAPPAAYSQSESVRDLFRKGNESASRGEFGEALALYERVETQARDAPSLYWNWSQVATAMGRKGETLWALLRTQQADPSDAAVNRDIERVRMELGLDPAETSLGLLGDVSLLARRNHLDRIGMVCAVLSLLPLLRKNPGGKLSVAFLTAAILMTLPRAIQLLSDSRAVIVSKDAPLLDAPRANAVVLSSLREGEVVPVLSNEGEYLKIQDASGARGFAHKANVRQVGFK